MNWISPTGFNPCAAMPTQSPLIRSSASGVSRTRSDPKRFCKPAVARKRPPLTPTSSPRTTTSGSSSSARASARLIASTNVASAIVLSRKFAALPGIGLGQIGIKVVEHGLGRAWRHCKIKLGRSLDALMALGGKLLLVRLAPDFSTNEICPQPGNRLLLPMSLNLFSRTIARRVVGGCMIAEPIGNRFDQPRAFAVAGRGHGLFSRSAHRHHVAAVDLLAGEACGDGFLREGFTGGLQSQRHRYRPLIIGGNEHNRQFVNAGKIHRFVNVTFRGGTIAEHAHGDTRFLAQSEGIGNA